MKTPLLHNADHNGAGRPRFYAFLPPLRSHLKAIRIVRIAILVLIGASSSLFAVPASFNWLATPGSDVWSTGANWSGGTAPNSSSHTAIFGFSNTTAIDVNNTTVGAMMFNPGASAYTFTVPPDVPGPDAFHISGTGIVNNSGITQNFVTDVDVSGLRGFLLFENSATAGNLIAVENLGSIKSGYNGGSTQFFHTSTAGSAAFTNNGAATIGANGGNTLFYDSSNAGTGTFLNKASALAASGGETDFSNSSSAKNGNFINEGGAVSGRQGGYTQFLHTSTADNGTFNTNGGTVTGALGGVTSFAGSSTAGNGLFITHGGTVPGADGGITIFTQNSTAANATLIANGGTNGGNGALLWFKDNSTGSATTTVRVFGNGMLDISQLTNGGLVIGSIQGDGDVFLGSKNLTVTGSQTTTFAGAMKNGGQGGGVGGSFTKNGLGNLTLAGNNTFSGPTRVNSGVLATMSSSALGTGPVTVAGGTLAPLAPLSVASLTWSGGLVALAPGLGTVINVNGAFTNGGAGGGFAIGPQSLEFNKAYTLVNFATTNFVLGQFQTSSTNAFVVYDAVFVLNGNNVQIIVRGATASGNLLHNITGNGIPTFGDFTLTVPTTSGLTTDGFQELQTIIRSFTSLAGGFLTVPGINNLTVTGNANLVGSILTVNGNMNVGGNLTDPNSTITVNGLLSVGGNTIIAGNSILNVNPGGTYTTTGNTTISDSTANIGGSYRTGGDLSLTNSNLNVNGTLTVVGNFIDPNSVFNVSGLVTVGGNTSITVNSTLNVNAGGVFTTSGNTTISDSTLNVNPGGLFTTTGNTDISDSTANIGGTYRTGGNLNVTNSAVTVNGLLVAGGNANLNSGANLRINQFGRMEVGNSTNINAGAVAIVNGALVSPYVNVNHGGFLGGSGYISGSVFNSGTVSPGEGRGTGTLHISGNYSQSRDGTLVISIPSRGGRHDVLDVGGRAKLNGTLQLSTGFAPQRHDSFTILTAGGGVSGEFSRFINPYPRRPGSLLYFGIGYEHNAVTIEAVQNDFKNALSIFQLTKNQTSVAAALDSALFDARQDDVLTHLDGLDIRKVPHELDMIAPEELTAIYTIGFSQMQAQVLSVEQRMADIRAGVPNQPAPPAPQRAGKGGKLVINPSVAESIDYRWGSFITMTGNFTTQGGSPNANGYDIDTGGTAVGIDYKVNDNFSIGISAGYARTDSDLVDGGNVKVDGGRAALYALYHQNGFFAQTLLGGGYNSYDTERSALEGTARGSTSGGELDAAVTLGYDAKMGALTVTPLASLLYTLVGISGYDESGSLQPLHIGSQSESSFRTRFGIRATYQTKVGAATVTPSFSAEWQHEFQSTQLAFDSRFANGAGNPFTVHGSDTGRDSALLTASVNVAWSRYAWYLAYQADLGRDNYQNQSILAGFRTAW